MTDGSGATPARRFFLVLACITAVGLTFRLVYALNAPVTSVSGDGSWYHYGANYLADGKGFINPYAYLFTRFSSPGADHPPAWTVVLAAASRIGIRTMRGHIVVACLVGTATIPTIGIVGRRVGGSRTGLIAALIAAAYPNFWMYESMLLSETLVILVVAVTILLALRFRDAPSVRRAVAVGAICGVLTLVRAEQICLLALLIVPVVGFAPRVDLGRRARLLGAALAASFVMISPWSILNLSRFQDPAVLTTNFGAALAISNCDQVYHGRAIGFWNNTCASKVTVRLGTGVPAMFPQILAARHQDASTLDAAERRLGVDYARAHLSELPAVVLAREGRAFNVFRPFQQMRFDLVEGSFWVLTSGLIMYWFLALFAFAGAVALRRRRMALWILVSFIATVAVATALTFGQTRYRAPADVSIVLLAALGIDEFIGVGSPTRADWDRDDGESKRFTRLPSITTG